MQQIKPAQQYNVLYCIVLCVLCAMGLVAWNKEDDDDDDIHVVLLIFTSLLSFLYAVFTVKERMFSVITQNLYIFAKTFCKKFRSKPCINPLKGRNVNWLHLAIKV